MLQATVALVHHVASYTPLPVQPAQAVPLAVGQGVTPLQPPRPTPVRLSVYTSNRVTANMELAVGFAMVN